MSEQEGRGPHDVVDADLLNTWVRTAVAALGDAREEIDALNVFPVPDGDTGTNMYLTLEAAERAMLEAAPGVAEGGGEAAMQGLSRALVTGALLGARGNSGVILSQILRGMVSVAPVDDGGARPAAEVIAAGLQRAADLAYASVGSPKEGTILTVVRKAAEAAQRAGTDSLADVVVAAADAADEALAATQEQLPALRDAGVVDSGGRGFVVILSALAEVVTGQRRPPPPVENLPRTSVAEAETDYSGPQYEVMYLLEIDDERVPALKGRLQALGDSLVVVGGDRLWNVHVHVDDAGAAVEAALEVGRPYRIRITFLLTAEARHAAPRGRGVVAVAHGPGIVALLEDSGVVPVVAQPRLAPATGEILAAVSATGAGEVVVLPSDKETRAAAEAAAVSAREQGLRVAVVPTRSITQSLAAIAVHDPEVPFDDDVVAMSRASGATRYGAVTVSSREAVTTAGRCLPGDVLGMVDGDILRIGSDMGTVACETLDVMLSAGAELATVVQGVDSTPDLMEVIAEHVRAVHPGVETVAYDGGQPLWPVIFGVE